MLLTACGGGRPAVSTPAAAYAACRRGGDSGACRRFLNRAVNVRSIALTANVPWQVRATCAETARLTRLRVICPPLEPSGGVVSDPTLYGPQVSDRRSYSISINNGQNPGRIHWEAGATTGPPGTLWIFDRSNWDARPPRRPARVVARRRYLGQVVTLYRFPDTDGQLAGHDAALAAKRGVTYFVSIHGHTHDDGDIAMLLAILARSS